MRPQELCPVQGLLCLADVWGSRVLSGSQGCDQCVSNLSATRSRNRLQWLWVPAEVRAAFRRLALCKESRVLPQLQKSWSVHINVKVRVLLRSLTLSLLFGAIRELTAILPCTFFYQMLFAIIYYDATYSINNCPRQPYLYFKKEILKYFFSLKQRIPSPPFSVPELLFDVV